MDETKSELNAFEKSNAEAIDPKVLAEEYTNKEQARVAKLMEKKGLEGKLVYTEDTKVYSYDNPYATPRRLRGGITVFEETFREVKGTLGSQTVEVKKIDSIVTSEYGSDIDRQRHLEISYKGSIDETDYVGNEAKELYEKLIVLAPNLTKDAIEKYADVKKGERSSDRRLMEERIKEQHLRDLLDKLS